MLTLFDPVTIGDLTTPNRIIMSPTTSPASSEIDLLRLA
jgi:2,4-dienoyl-CoA reductase-like NADH-dependent reductase (Old Yellow Enzyme family)